MLAEREGFEPSEGYKPSHDFESCAFNRSATSPEIYQTRAPEQSPARGAGYSTSGTHDKGIAVAIAIDLGVELDLAFIREVLGDNPDLADVVAEVGQ